MVRTEKQYVNLKIVGQPERSSAGWQHLAGPADAVQASRCVVPGCVGREGGPEFSRERVQTCLRPPPRIPDAASRIDGTLANPKRDTPAAPPSYPLRLSQSPSFSGRTGRRISCRAPESRRARILVCSARSPSPPPESAPPPAFAADAIPPWSDIPTFPVPPKTALACQRCAAASSEQRLLGRQV